MGDGGTHKFSNTASTIYLFKSFRNGGLEQRMQNPPFEEKENFIGTFIKGNSLYNTFL